ncbi:MAG: ArsR family transcriptional regulator [Proteobacteria bacterium]|nr:ArsR family transcriptional regulator [Pseudomonadota bacterium]
MKEKKVVRALAALAQESRLAVFRLLMEGEEVGMSAGAISKTLQIPPTTMSFHLAQLKTAGLVDSRKEGRSIIYSANRKRVKKIANYLTAKKPVEAEYTL